MPLTNGNNVQNESIENTEIYLSVNTKKLIDMQNDDTFCATLLKLINEKMSPQTYFINDKTWAQSYERRW